MNGVNKKVALDELSVAREVQRGLELDDRIRA